MFRLRQLALQKINIPAVMTEVNCTTEVPMPGPTRVRFRLYTLQSHTFSVNTSSPQQTRQSLTTFQMRRTDAICVPWKQLWITTLLRKANSFDEDDDVFMLTGRL